MAIKETRAAAGQPAGGPADQPAGEPARARPGMPVGLRLLAALVGLAGLGTLLLLLPGMSTRPLTISEAMFMAVSAVTVTGLSVILLPADLTTLGQATLLVLMQVGGIGVMVLTVVLFLLMGRRVSLLDRIALRSTLGSIVPGAVFRLMGRVLAGVLLIEASGALLLYLHWRGTLGDARALGYAVFHAVSAFCNAGFDLFTGSPDFPGGMPTDPFTLAVLAGLITVGGLGVPVLANLIAFARYRWGAGPRLPGTVARRAGLKGRAGRTGLADLEERAEARAVGRLNLHTRLTLAAFLILTLVGAVGVFLAEGVEAGHPAGESLGIAFFQSIVARTAGFTIPGSFEALSPASRFLLMVLMFIGTAPASMGGGITTGTAVILALAMVAYLRGRDQAVVAGRTISHEITRRALAVLVVSILVVLVATWLILLTHPGEDVTDALFEVVSAFATCGLSLSFTGRLNGWGRVVLMMVMIWGRLGPLGIVLALARKPESPRVAYPEEQVLIG